LFLLLGEHHHVIDRRLGIGKFLIDRQQLAIAETVRVKAIANLPPFESALSSWCRLFQRHVSVPVSDPGSDSPRRSFRGV
jgi:hypothetical protein